MPMKFSLLEIPESENFYNHVDYKKAIFVDFEENKKCSHSFTFSSELLCKLYSPYIQLIFYNITF